MEEQFAVSGWVYSWMFGTMAYLVVSAFVSRADIRRVLYGGAVFMTLMAIRRIVEDVVNYLAVS